MKWRTCGAALAATVTLAACAADEPEATPPTASARVMTVDVEPGALIEVPVHIAGTDAVAVQFDLHYDPRALELAETVSERVADAPTKAFTVRHLGEGMARVVVFGSDLEPLPSGVLGTLKLRGLAEKAGVGVEGRSRVVVDREGRRRDSGFADGRLAVLEGEVRHDRP